MQLQRKLQQQAPARKRSEDLHRKSTFCSITAQKCVLKEETLLIPVLERNLEHHHEILHDAELEKRSTQKPLKNSVLGENFGDHFH